ncbi:hypothetical protein [Amycolatopsis sp. NPDC001319]|uniref:hypothetical protein n=1 Tax=unclassified Amycolatopsis TaxID=2618356 RepID=UPI0036C7FD41
MELPQPVVDRTRAMAPRSSVPAASLPWERVLDESEARVVVLRSEQVWREHLPLEITAFTAGASEEFRFFPDRFSDHDDRGLVSCSTTAASPPLCGRRGIRDGAIVACRRGSRWRPRSAAAVAGRAGNGAVRSS